MECNKNTNFIRDPQYINAVQLGPNTILNIAQQRETLEKVLTTLNRLNPDELIQFTQAYYRAGIQRFAEHWGYADQLTVLCAVSSLLNVEHYLEIGVLCGRSLAIVASVAQDANIYAFDLWQGDYAHIESLGPDYVRTQLERVGYRGQAQLISGDSHKTLPKYFEDHPNLYLDLITVDGDHSASGARIDLELVLPRLKLGGVLIFDDITHPKHLSLEHVWDDVVSSNPNFTTAKFKDIGHGVAVAIRRSTNIDFDPLKGNLEERVAILSKRYQVAQEALVQDGQAYQSLQQHLRESEQDRSHQLDNIKLLGQRLTKCEQDRSQRLKDIHELQQRLHESEADRTERMEVIQRLESRLQASEIDRAARLEAINELDDLLQVCEADREARLKVIRRLESELKKS